MASQYSSGALGYGKLRDKIMVPAGSSDEDLKAKALDSDKIKAALDGKQIIKVIVANKKLVNVVCKSFEI